MPEPQEPTGRAEVESDLVSSIGKQMRDAGLHPRQAPPDEGPPDVAPPAGAPDSSPVTDAPEMLADGTPADKPIPYERFAEVQQQLKTVQASNDALREELESERQRGLDIMRHAMTHETPPEDFEQWPTHEQGQWHDAHAGGDRMRHELGQGTIDRILDMSLESDLRHDLEPYGYGSEEIAAVAAVRREHPNLTTVEAAHVAAARNPSLFSAEEDAEPHEAMHPGYGVTEPGSTSRHQAPPDAEDTLNEALAAAPGKHDKMMALAKYISGNRRESG